MSPVALDLLIGRRRTGISVRPDPVHPSMWRIHEGDRVSDMVNLARAKDAAVRGIVDVDHPHHWKAVQSAPEATSSDLNQAAE
jgi:hypothetical protein